MNEELESLFALMQEDVAGSHVLSDSYLAQIKNCYKVEIMKDKYKITTNYSIPLKTSEYDYLEVEEGNDSRIRIKFLDTRWRTKSETIKMLEEIISHLN